MKQVPIALLTLILLSGSFAQSEETKEPKKQDKPKQGKTVEVKDLKLTLPKGWTAEKPSNNLRLGQFKIKAAEGDKEPTELVIFNFGGGGGAVQANIQRWVGQFGAEGRTAKILTGKSTQGDYIAVDISGTYNLPVGPPIRRQTKEAKGYRMVALILQIEDKGVYYLKLVGPQKTVESASSDLRKAIGADMSKEKQFVQ